MPTIEITVQYTKRGEFDITDEMRAVRQSLRVHGFHGVTLTGRVLGIGEEPVGGDT